uniref:EF-hand domain-containing protein n=1 Tax=Arcella intermedia TaxID=1963864 RepID=A0A6B2LPI9_9EUKA|eukprot:TRINITY_DN5724_c0_g1_i1.p1 TRINITY_DN5724_c0_g1~~TRINITY_DN5724_c0_g1_i1.p1  ORF type:complete len:153 (-),score=53.31 TRINITY_DN5724_c0_g1_i1:57-476(-)
MADKLQEIFSLWDVEGNNTIETKNFQFAFRAAGLAPTEEELEKITNEIDEGGKISFAKFKTACDNNKKLGQNIEELAISAFQVFDRDDNGTVQSQEMKHILTALGDKLTEEEADDFINECTPNPNDGTILYKKFVDKIK